MDNRQPAAIKRILAPLDGSDRAEAVLPYARAIGGANVELILLEVVPAANNVRNIFGQVIASESQVQQGYSDIAKENLERAAAQFGNAAHIEQTIATGDPAEQILREAAERNVDLIALTSQGRGAWGPNALGSIVDRVVRTATQPVLVVPPRGSISGVGGTSRPLTGVVLPVDGSDYAAEAIPVAAAIAKRLNLPVRVVQAVATTGALPPGLSAADDHEARTTARANAQNAVDAAVNQLKAAGINAGGEVLTGEPVSTLISATGFGDLVVISSHGQAGVGRWVLGSVADKLIHAGTAPVVLVPVAERGG